MRFLSSKKVLIYYTIHERLEDLKHIKTFFIAVQNVKYILSDTYFCPNSIKIENDTVWLKRKNHSI